MSDINKFAQAIMDADLPKQEEILIALGELYVQKGYKKTLERMAKEYVEYGCRLHSTFSGGFDWSNTPQGHDWWRDNVKNELFRREL